MKITAKEIERQATRVEEELEIFSRDYNEVVKAFMSMCRIVSSDDSNLSDVLNSYGNSYVSVHAYMNDQYRKLAQFMHEYAAQTIANEETTAAKVEVAKQDIESIVKG